MKPRKSSAKLGGRSEFDFIESLRQRASSTDSSLATRHSSLVKGIGDDAAAFTQQAGRETLITTDLLVEDVDFRLSTTTPRALGHKALAVSLSDIAAMGARPLWALVSLGVPSQVWESNFLEQFYEGFFALADAHGVALIGGDLSRTPRHVFIDSVVLGDAATGRAVMRAGARAGDQIFVTGALGGAAAGLRLLEAGARPARTPPKSPRTQAREQLLLRQLCPMPRVAWGRLLGERRLATASIDLSDGLSSDLAHLCRASGVGAEVEAALLPLDPALARTGLSAQEALSLALDGGEDFELLFTVRPRDASKLPAEVEGVAVTRIGEVTAEAEKMSLLVDGRAEPLRPGGFEHFRRSG
ncbi:MAG TPA: thiamine-phosphate kinase [Pyrinomonadaceae bacterium]|nr:thiamine-phosphate kinase [Pyrinomonadaceae bacterium]